MTAGGFLERLVCSSGEDAMTPELPIVRQSRAFRSPLPPTMKTRLTIAAVILLASPLHAFAQSNPIIDDYIEKSGMGQLVAQVKDSILRGIDQAQAQLEKEGEKQAQSPVPKLAPDQLERLRTAVSAAYDAGRLRDSLRSNLQRLLPGGDTEVVLRWLDSPLGKRVTAIEIAGSSPEGARRAGPTAAKTYAELSASRREDIDMMAKVSGAVEVSASFALAQGLGIGRGMAAAAGTYVPPAGDSAKSEYLRTHAAAASRAWVENAATTYAPLSDAELRQYAMVVSGASQRRVLDATGMALDRTLSSAADELLRQLGMPAPAAASKSAT
jgi:hypothetical protein